MIDIKDNAIEITKEDGTKETWKILFYYHNDERGKDYYLIFQDSDPDSLLVMSSVDGKELSNVSEEEFEEAEETLEAYENDPKIAAIK